MNKLIYHFGSADQGAQFTPDNNIDTREALGGKGIGLLEMSELGLPVPAGFTISTALCRYYYQNNRTLPQGFAEEISSAVARLEVATGKNFAAERNPLLLSVRSGAKVSMPGMMDTILNLGINEQSATALASSTGDMRFAYDTYRRFLQMYGNVVLEIPHHLFEEIYEHHKESCNVVSDAELDGNILQEVLSDYRRLIYTRGGNHFTENPYEQLIAAIKAVFDSWMSPRAIIYRKIHNIPDDMGTAVSVQSMVFGNKGSDSGTGVVFTRSPATGEKMIFGEFLQNAQGEDLVAGLRTPHLITSDRSGNTLQDKMPEIFMQLKNICRQLEDHYGDMQDIEFTIEDGRLYILQTRSGKRAAAAAVKIAVDMVREGKISKEEALLAIEPESLNQLLHAAIDYRTKPEVVAIGLAASPGAASGIVVFLPHEAEQLSHHHDVILVRNDTSPDDIKGMHVSVGIITARGGMTSHAAVVARGMGVPCVCGVRGLRVDEQTQSFTTDSGKIVKKGDVVTIDGSSGNIIVGAASLIEPQFSEEFSTILSWADENRTLHIRANAETVTDAKVSLKFGAEAVGLCRTEHMFFESEKIYLVQEMIIAPDAGRRQKAINALMPLQVKDFKGILNVMEGKAINIRLLDPPLHEFLPRKEHEQERLATSLDMSLPAVQYRLHTLHEVNPMLGHRGCRLGITYPEIYEMQVKAILTAAKEVYNESGQKSNIELMVPLISNNEELSCLLKNIKRIVALEDVDNQHLSLKIGTMIELPRAALIAGEIASQVEYFSFGTNDLTQTTYGISRDDIGSFLPEYLSQNIVKVDPFVEIDQQGVGELMKIAIERGSKANNALTFGVCGEHAGDPKSIDFFNQLGVDYISCSPYRIPIARIAAAQSSIKRKMNL